MYVEATFKRKRKLYLEICECRKVGTLREADISCGSMQTFLFSQNPSSLLPPKFTLGRAQSDTDYFGLAHLTTGRCLIQEVTVGWKSHPEPELQKNLLCTVTNFYIVNWPDKAGGRPKQWCLIRILVIFTMFYKKCSNRLKNTLTGPNMRIIEAS